MNVYIIFVMFIMGISITRANEKIDKKIDQQKDKKVLQEEVLTNPTLKTLSGSLSRWSFYSAFDYKGGSIAHPTSAERPNIAAASEKPSLQSLSGNLGIKFRATKNDNFSLRVGMFMATPFHQRFHSDNPRVQQEFDQNARKLNFDDPSLSYFRTYHMGQLQNVSFVTAEKTTTGVLTDYGYFGNLTLSHATAFPLSKSFYIAGTLSATQLFFDKNETINARGKRVNLVPYQVERVYTLGFSLEYYYSEKIALRAITGIASYQQMRENQYKDIDRRDVQQTLALTYFITRDISIAPSLRFIVNDIKSERTNLGLTANLNL